MWRRSNKTTGRASGTAWAGRCAGARGPSSPCRSETGSTRRPISRPATAPAGRPTNAHQAFSCVSMTGQRAVAAWPAPGQGRRREAVPPAPIRPSAAGPPDPGSPSHPSQHPRRCNPGPFRRGARRLVVLLLAPPLLYRAASVALPLIPDPGPDLSGSPARIIGLLQGPIHTEILFPPTTKTRARFAFAGAAGVPLNHPDAECLVFGWGSAAFDTSAGI